MVAVTDVGDEGGPLVEGVEDGGLGVGELGAEELLYGPVGDEGGDVVDVGLEVPGGEVGLVGDEDGLSVEGEAGVLEVEDLVDGVLGLVDRVGGETTDGEVGEEVVAVDGGEGGVGGCPEEGGLGEGGGEEVLAGLEPLEALGVGGGLTEEEDVTGSGLCPVVVGEGEEVVDGLGETSPKPKES